MMDKITVTEVRTIRRQVARHCDEFAISLFGKMESELTTLRAELDNIKRSWALLHTENEQLRQRIADAEGQEPVAKVTYLNLGVSLQWLPKWTELKAGDKLYARPIPSDRVADKPRITEQDALAIVASAMYHYDCNRNSNVAKWLELGGRNLLNKLNADRVTASVTDNFNGNDRKLIDCATALLDLDADGKLVPHGIGGHARTIIESFVARMGAKQVPAVAVHDGWKLVPVDPTDEMLATAWEIEVECHNHGKTPDVIYLGEITGKEVWQAMLSASPAPTNGLEAALPKPLPYWPPCNPGCDPEFNGERSAWCADHCKPARDAMNADQCPSHESEQPKILPIPVVTGSKGLQAGITDSGAILCRIDAGIADHE